MRITSHAIHHHSHGQENTSSYSMHLGDIAFCRPYSTVLGITLRLFLKERDKILFVSDLQLRRINGVFCNTVF